MESVLMTPPPLARARSSASADLPLAVGPAISTGLLLVPCEVTRCLSSPRSSAIRTTPRWIRPSSTARAVLPAAGPAHWLWDEVAADIPFDAPTRDKDDIRAFSDRLRAARGDLPIDVVGRLIATRPKKLF